MKLSETFIDKPQTPVAITVKLLQVSQAQIMGQMKITDDQSLAIQQGRSGSQLRWTLPDDLAAGWYHLRFAGTSHYQVIADWLDENEPYVLHVSTPEKRQEKQQSFTYRIPDAPVKAVDDLPAPLLRPTLVQDWQSSQPMWLEPGMQFDLAVRRPLLVMGDVSLLPVASNQWMWPRKSHTTSSPRSMAKRHSPLICTTPVMLFLPASSSKHSPMRWTAARNPVSRIYRCNPTAD
jgi:hypothetical protein